MEKRESKRQHSTFCSLLFTLTLLLFCNGQNAYAAADIQPTSFLDNIDPVPAQGEVTYSVVVKSNDIAAPVTAAWLEIPIPSGFTFVSVNDSGCLYSGITPSVGGVNDKIRCDWATITTQKNVDFHVLAPDTTGIYTLTATTGAAVNSNTSNDTEMVTTQVVTSADLQLTSKTGTPNPAPGGSIVTYDFIVTNNGPYPASTLTLSDTLPTGLTFVADNANPAANQDSDWSCSAAGQVVTCTASSLAVSATPSVFHVRVQVTKATTGAITNAASVSASTPDPKPDNNTATHNLTVIDGTDMAIAKSVATNPVIGGQPAQFTLTATNNGPMSAANVVVRDTLPSGYTSISMISTPAGWNCAIDDISDPPVITCSIASVAAGASSVFTISATPPATAAIVTHQNSAQVATTTTDPIGSNDNVTVSYDVNPDIADLSISKTKSPDPVAQGSDITSTIVVHNNGPRPADPVQVVDVLSGGETYVSYSGTNWSCTHNGVNPGGTVTCSYSAVPLANGANTATLTIITTATNAGVLTNTACTGGDGGSAAPGYGDTNTGNNCANGSVTSTTEQADLVVTKSTSDPDIDPTENSFTYTVTIHNNGPQTAGAIDFRDTIPQYIAAGSGGRPATGLTATPDNGSSCTITNALVQCNLGDIVSGATVTIPITVTRPMRDGTLTNTASAYSTLTGDPVRSNNVASVDVTVQPVTDIEVTDKSVTYAEAPDPILAGTIATYTIQVRNNGPSTAQTVTLADVFSGEAFDFIDSSVAGGGSCTYDSPSTTLNCALDDMAASTTKAITVRIRPDHNVTPIGAWQIDNTATVSMVTTDSNPANNSKSENLPIILGVADLSITKNESPSFTEPVRFVPLGTNYIVYKIDIANNGPSLATGVTFTDKMNSVSPATGQSIKFVEDTANPDGTSDALNICDTIGTTFVVGAASPDITCALANDPAYPQGRLASGASYTRYLVFQVLDSPDAVSGDSYHDVATVAAHETEPTPGNNTEDESTTVRTIVDLGLVKTASKTPVEVAENFSYTLTVTNHGPGKSPETTVTDTLPAGMVLTSPPVPSIGTCTGIAGNTSFSCALGLMDNGDAATITVPVKVTAWTVTKNNCATVTSLAPEPFPVDPSPNQGCVTITIQQPATLGNVVWLDRNANGVQNGEPGINNVTVRLLDAGFNQVATTTTDSSGIYSFIINHAANYYVEFVKPVGYFPSPKDAASGTEATDSDADTGTGRTDVITVNYGDNIDTVDAGLYQKVSLGDRVWHDSDADGTQDAGEPGIPGITVKLLDSSLAEIATTTTNPSGIYSFSDLDPGDYSVQVTPPSWVGYLPSPIQSTTPNNNINIDSNIASIPVAGTYRSAVINLGSGQEPTTDGDNNNGNLTLDFGLVLPGSVGNRIWLDEDSNGRQDAGESGIANVVVQFKNATTGAVITTTTTDTNGGYLFTDLPPGDYVIQVDAASVPAGMSQTANYPAAGTDLVNQNQSAGFGYTVHVTSGGENLTADFGYNWNPSTDVINGTNTTAFGDRVWLDTNGNGIQDGGEMGVEGVTLTLLTAGPDGLFGTGDDVTAGTTNTDAAGNYIFNNLAAGAYVVQVTDSGLASHNILTGSYIQTGDPDHFAANLITAPAGTAQDNKSTRPVILAPGDVFVNADFGYQPNGAPLHAIGDTIWVDFNRDGVQDAGDEPGIQGVVVALKNTTGDIIATTTTDATGRYRFTDLPDGTYTVVVIDSDNVLSGFTPSYDQDNGTSNPDQQSTVILAASDNLDQDFGYAPISAETETGAIGDTIFLDRNGNGAYDAGEGLEGVQVVLKDGLGAVIAIAYTDENGHYYFGGLAAGNYTVEVVTSTLPPGATNSVDPDGGFNSISAVTLAAGQINMAQDFGYVADTAGTIGNLVWKDMNADGIYDADGMDNTTNTVDDETGLSGVGMSLFRDLNNNNLLDANEPLVATTTTDSNGGYLFAGLPADEYIVKVSDPANRLEGYWHSLGNTGLNNNSQADYYPVSLSAGDEYLAADFGYYYQPGSVGNLVWKDVNANGLYDAGDTGMADIPVYLDVLYPNGTTVTLKTVTDANGLYSFINLLLDETHNGISNTSYGNGGDEPLHTVRIDAGDIPSELAAIYPTRVRNTDSTTVGGVVADDEVTDIGSDPATGEPAYSPMGSADITNDFGWFEPGSIGDTIFNDANNNGLIDALEGLAGVTVQLTPPANANLGAGLGVAITTITDASGMYLFPGLPPGDYTVTVVETSLPAVLQGHNTIDPNGGNNSASAVTLSVNQDNLAQDFGYFVACSIGNFVWDDSNSDGLQTSGESGHQGITVQLLDGGGNPVMDPAHPSTPYVMLTGANGEYLFADLLPGNYQVQFVLPSNNSFTSQNSGGDDTLDSDPIATGIVAVTLAASEANFTVDAGLVGPGINIEKYTNGNDADAAPGVSVQIGDTINWTYVVANTGTVALTGVTVNDDKGVAVTCPATTLAVGATMTCTGSGVAVAGQYVNIGTALGTPPAGPAVTDTDPSHYLAGSPGPAVDIKKYTNGIDADTAPGPVLAVGSPVNWTYVVTNTGNEALTSVTVTDDKGVAVTCPANTLAVGATMTCTATGLATAGQYENSGSVNATSTNGIFVTDSDLSHYFGNSNNFAAITLIKTTNGEDANTTPGPYIETGHGVTWAYAVTNTGNIDLHNVTVTDDKFDSSAIHCPDDGNTDNRMTLLPVGASAICSASGTAVGGQYENTGFVIGSPQVGPSVTATDPSHYFGDDGTIDIEKATNGEDADTAPGPVITINKSVTWTYVVTNTGQFPLTEVTVADDKDVVVTCPKATLAVAESMTCTGTGKAIKGQYENTGLVTAKTPDNKTVQDSDLSHYFGKSSLLLFLPPIIRPQCPPVPDYCYVVADGDNDNSTNSPLFKYIFKDNTLELLNRLGVDDVEAIVLSEDGKTLYGADNGVFGIINPTPGVNNSFTPLNPSGIGQGRGSLGTVSLNDIDGLSFDPTNGVLYGTIRQGEGSDNRLDLLIQIDPRTGTLVRNAFAANVDYVVLSTNAVDNYDVDDIAIDTNGIMYGIGGNSSGGGGDKLLIINKQTGAVQHYGSLNNQGAPVQDMEGLTLYNNNVLYGSTGMEFGGSANTLYRIEKQTGKTTPVNQLDQNINRYIPTDFEAISCFPVCR